MAKRTIAALVVGTVLLALVAFYIGSSVFPGVFDDAEDTIVPEASAELAAAAPAPADVAAGWGIEPSNPASSPVVTPENSPLEHVALDGSYLASLSAPAEGRFAGTVASVEEGRGAVVLAQTFEVIDRSGDTPVLRVLQSGSRVFVEFGSLLDKEQMTLLAEGDFLMATVLLEPGARGWVGRLVLQSYESAPK